MRMLLVFLITIALSACSEQPAQSSKAGLLDTLSKKTQPYVGEWEEIDGNDKIRIYAEGDAYVLVDGEKKYPALIENGALRVHHSIASLVALHTPSNDHLLIAGDEYQRVIPEDPYVAAAKRTMADMRTIATCLEARATDTNSYSPDGTETQVSSEALAPLLEPTYTRRLPRTDAWEKTFTIRMDGRTYEIRSDGADRAPDPTRPGTTSHPDCDIVFANGAFVTFPSAVPIQ